MYRSTQLLVSNTRSGCNRLSIPLWFNKCTSQARNGPEMTRIKSTQRDQSQEIGEQNLQPILVVRALCTTLLRNSPLGGRMQRHRQSISCLCIRCQLRSHRPLLQQRRKTDAESCCCYIGRGRQPHHQQVLRVRTSCADARTP